MSACRRCSAAWLAACSLLSATATVAAPGDVLYSDDFNDGSLAPWTTTNSSRSGILNGGQVSGSNPRGAYTRHGPVSVTSPAINAAVPAARLSIWVRRGDDDINGSEDTDATEDFVIEYRRADGSFATLASYLGSGTNGQIYQDAFTLPADALHGNLAVRVRQTAGSGVDFDYWHFDDVVVTEIAVPGPLGVGSCDDFENGLSNWSVNAGTGLAGTSSATSSSPSNSLFLNGGSVDVTSAAIDTSAPGFTDLTVWIRRGRDTFSEDPDAGEDLVVEYLDSANNWVVVETFSGSGGPGQVFNRSYTLPAAARHPGFRLRFRLLAGSGAVFDFWHVDDVCLVEIPFPDLLVTKIAQTLSDPVNGTTNPKSIPGAIVQYTITVANQGDGPVDADSLRITDPVPANTDLFVDTASGDPISFVDGATPSGLSFSYANDVQHSNQPGGSPYGYTPAPDADGFDPAVTGFEVAPSGTMNAASGAGNPSFSVVFRVRLR